MIYVILLKKMVCKNEGLVMEGEYEKKPLQNLGWGGLRHNTDPKFYPWKKIPSRENSQHSAREIKNSTRENLSNTARENPRVPVKMFKKVGVKMNFHPWKKPQKEQKRAFPGTFDFHGKKNTGHN